MYWYKRFLFKRKYILKLKINCMRDRHVIKICYLFYNEGMSSQIMHCIHESERGIGENIEGGILASQGA